ncbi:unnamed protein product [Camellia sinensis]
MMTADRRGEEGDQMFVTDSGGGSGQLEMRFGKITPAPTRQNWDPTCSPELKNCSVWGFASSIVNLFSYSACAIQTSLDYFHEEEGETYDESSCCYVELQKRMQGYATSEEMYTSGFIPSFSFLSKLLNKSLKSGYLIEDALYALKLMLRLDYCPPEPNLNLLIVCLSKAGMITEAYFVFSVLLQRDSFRDDGKIEEALDLLDKMEKEGCDPDLVTYNIILHKLCHQSRVAEIGELVRVIDQKGLYPDPFTHAALVGGLLKGGKIGVATKFLLNVISRGCTVDVVMYNIYFNILCHENRSSESLSLLRSMMEIGFRPNNVSYNTILKGFCKDNIDEALELFDHIEWGANGPDIVSFNTILSAACKQGNSPMIRRILYRKEYEGIKLNVVSSTCLIQYFCMVGKILECLKLLEAMISNGPSPTIGTFNTLMSGLCKNRFLGTALRIFKYLKSTGVLPDMIAYNILIRASVRESNDELMGQLLREMCSPSLKPDVVTFGSFSYGLCKEGKISVAFQLQNQMIENGITPSISIYNTILEAMSKSGKFWDIILLLKEMVMEGCEPNAVSFEILYRAITNGWMKDILGLQSFWSFVHGPISSTTDLGYVDGFPQAGPKSLDGLHLMKILRNAGGARPRRTHDEAMFFGMHPMRPTPMSRILQPPTHSRTDASGSKCERVIPLNVGPSMQYPPRVGQVTIFGGQVPSNRFMDANAGPSAISQAAADEGSGVSDRNPSGVLLTGSKQKSGTHNSKSESLTLRPSQHGSTSSSRQMTIFYGGQAYVFDDVRPNKGADVIMALAGLNGGSWSTTFVPKSTAPVPGESYIPSGEKETGMASNFASSWEYQWWSSMTGTSSHGFGSGDQISVPPGSHQGSTIAEDGKAPVQAETRTEEKQEYLIKQMGSPPDSEVDDFLYTFSFCHHPILNKEKLSFP